MSDEKIAILQKIVDFHGDCESFAGPAVCKRCPLGNKKVNGHRINCTEYLNINARLLGSEEELNEIYAKAAEEELFRIKLEECLLED